VKDEVVNVKIFDKGKKFDLGFGNQFDTLEEFIEYYKKYPFSVSEGKEVKLQQVLITSVVILRKMICFYDKCISQDTHPFLSTINQKFWVEFLILVILYLLA